MFRLVPRFLLSVGTTELCDQSSCQRSLPHLLPLDVKLGSLAIVQLLLRAELSSPPFLSQRDPMGLCTRPHETSQVTIEEGLVGNVGAGLEPLQSVHDAGVAAGPQLLNLLGL